MKSDLMALMGRWPAWATQLLFSLLTVAGAYLVGQAIRAVALPRLGRLAARTSMVNDEVLVRELRRRVPLWSLLVGLYLSLDFWHLTRIHEDAAVRMLSAVGVASVTFALAAIATRVVVSYGPRSPVPVSGLTQNVVRIVIVGLGILVIVRSFGYDITAALTVLGVGGLAVALALQDPLSNFFAGLSVSLAGNIRIGDYIRLDSGAEGYLLDFNWRSTRLRQLAGNIVEVPNSKLAQAIVTNFTLPVPEMGIGVDVTVSYANDLAVVERLAIEVATEVIKDVPGGVLTAAPAVRFNGFTDTGVKFSVGARVQGFVDQFIVKHELIKRLHARFAAAGVAMPDVRKP
ncbi:MAG: mechanosensitive ion channel family protein [Vicinamibacterales bacterium]